MVTAFGGASRLATGTIAADRAMMSTTTTTTGRRLATWPPIPRRTASAQLFNNSFRRGAARLHTRPPSRRYPPSSSLSSGTWRTAAAASWKLPAGHRHAFTASAGLRETTWLTKPKLDMGGNEMSIVITPRAGKQLSAIIKETNNPSFALRVRVQSGGCHGFQYMTTNETLPTDLAKVAEEDCVFRYIEDGSGDAQPSFHGPKVVLDEASLLALQGSKVDFVQELIGSKFEVVDNPAAANSCGCGSSFSLNL